MNHSSLKLTIVVALIAALLTGMLFFPFLTRPGKTSNNYTTQEFDFQTQIGDYKEGGIVFYRWKDSIGKEHGLIASLTDIDKPSPATLITRNLIGLRRLCIPDGKLEVTSPLQCNLFSQSGYTDWFLPQAWQMNELFKQGLLINEALRGINNERTQPFIFFSSHYWTIPTHNSGNAWDQCYFSDFSTGYSKDYVGKVRAIRQF